MGIRKFAPGDAREIERLYRALHGSVEALDPWKEQLFVHDRGGGRLGGFLALSRSSGVDPGNATAACVGAWFVDPRYRRQGIGTKLMQAAEHWARLEGLAELCSSTETGNAAGLAAHDRLGFELAREIRHYRKLVG